MTAGRVDFFVSSTSADRPRAEWIARELVHAAHSVIVQAWDFLPGAKFPPATDAVGFRGSQLGPEAPS